MQLKCDSTLFDLDPWPYLNISRLAKIMRGNLVHFDFQEVTNRKEHQNVSVLGPNTV